MVSPVSIPSGPTSSTLGARSLDEVLGNLLLLIENVRHHMDEEEQDWFPQVREGLGRKVLQELGAEMLESKKKAPRRPFAAERVEKDCGRDHRLSVVDESHLVEATHLAVTVVQPTSGGGGTPGMVERSRWISASAIGWPPLAAS